MRDVVLSPAWLPWNRNSSEEQLFLKVLAISLGGALLLGALVPLINLPDKKREEVEAIPPRLARMLMERKPPEPNKSVKRTEEQPLPSQSEQPVQMSAARRKAAGSGLLAMSHELAALSSTAVLDKVTAGSTLNHGGSQQIQRDTAMVSNAAQGSGGIDISSLPRERATDASLQRHTTTQVALAKEDAARIEKQHAQGGNEKGAEPSKRMPKRDADTISEILDRNKGAVYAIYNRALRQNALLAGNVIFAITIEPSGKVSDCRVVASELHDEELERKLAARITMINFGAESVPQLTVKWPLNFLPS